MIGRPFKSQGRLFFVVVSHIFLLLNDHTVWSETYKVDWIIPSDGGPLPAVTTARVGDTAQFDWGYYHNVYIHPSKTCDTRGRELVGGGFSTSASYTFQESDAGQDVVFACDVGPHCELGQIITFTVLPATTPTPTAAKSSVPTKIPSNNPTSSPTVRSSDTPSGVFSVNPTDFPTTSVAPTMKPSTSPSEKPSFTSVPTSSFVPSTSPTSFPTAPPSASPSPKPTVMITVPPTPNPTSFFPVSNPTISPKQPPLSLSLPVCTSDRPNSWATHRTVFVPRTMMENGNDVSTTPEEQAWAQALCCVYTHVTVTNSEAPRGRLRLYDGSSYRISADSFVDLASKVMDDICNMPMGSEDCLNQSACIDATGAMSI